MSSRSDVITVISYLFVSFDEVSRVCLREKILSRQQNKEIRRVFFIKIRGTMAQYQGGDNMYVYPLVDTQGVICIR